ncbi:MAG: hypothetical protein WCO14_02995 [bacterium]
MVWFDLASFLACNRISNPHQIDVNFDTLTRGEVLQLKHFAGQPHHAVVWSVHHQRKLRLRGLFVSSHATLDPVGT